METSQWEPTTAQPFLVPDSCQLSRANPDAELDGSHRSYEIDYDVFRSAVREVGFMRVLVEQVLHLSCACNHMAITWQSHSKHIAITQQSRSNRIAITQQSASQLRLQLRLHLSCTYTCYHLCSLLLTTAYCYLLLLTTSACYSLLHTTTRYYLLLLTTTHYYSLLLTTAHYPSRLNIQLSANPFR